jgi:hypothetical protein
MQIVHIQKSEEVFYFFNRIPVQNWIPEGNSSNSFSLVGMIRDPLLVAEVDV